MDSENKYMVCARCLTYNHSNYIKDAMDGFVKQQTCFPFVCTIIDDASTDGEQEVVEKYLEDNFDLSDTSVAYEKEEDYGHVVFARHKKNQNCFFAVVFLNENHYSQRKPKSQYLERWTDDAKYIAVCEGDDYWIDPLKLQKQVDILEADDTLMAVVANAKVVDKGGKELVAKQKDVVPDNKQGRYDLRSFFNNVHHYPTATVCYRRTHENEIKEKTKIMSNPFLGDWTKWIAYHIYGDFYYIDQVVAAYRINPTSVTHTVDRVERAKANWPIINSVIEVLPSEYSDLRKKLKDTSWMWEDLGFAYKAQRKYLRMGGCFLLSFVNNPRNAARSFRKKLKNRKDEDCRKTRV